MISGFHKSVLLKEVIDALQVKSGKRYIDATLGGGGHALEIVKRGGIVLGIDIDQEAIEHVKKILRDKDIRILSERRDKALNILVSQYPNITLVNGNFKDIREIARLHGFDKVAGILFDLGVSSHQLESQNRGFSFQIDSPLDMRMSARGGSGQEVTAADLINGLTRKELYELFTKLAQEPNSWAISNSIVRARKIRPITTTRELASLVVGVYRRIYNMRSKIHPATKVFQALRIAVNNELENLRLALPAALELLEKDGRLVVISFHSLEEEIVKEFMKDKGRPITPTEVEIRSNPRSRSAKMRVFERH